VGHERVPGHPKGIKDRLAHHFTGAEVTLVPDTDWHTNKDVHLAMTVSVPKILTEIEVMTAAQLLVAPSSFNAYACGYAYEVAVP
jgi:hypothetical protein